MNLNKSMCNLRISIHTYLFLSLFMLKTSNTFSKGTQYIL